MNNDLVSIIIPTFNRKDTILKSLQSILNQTHKNIEVIIVDDGSTDETYRLFEKQTDKRINFYRYEKNQGACYARNYGFSKSNGVYIAFHDSDDEWVPSKLEEQLHELKKNNYDFIFCGMTRIKGNNKYYFPMTKFNENGDVLHQQLMQNHISTQTMLMKREVLEKVNFDITFKRFQDWDFSLQVILNNFKIGYLEEPLVISEVQKNSISANIKTSLAYEHLYEKYKDLYNNNKELLAVINANIASGYRHIDKKKCRQYLKKSLKGKFNMKVLIKYICSFIKIY